MFEAYRAYVKDNPQGYWFKRKLYGWGWTPVVWQGWVTTLGYIVGAMVLAFMTPKEASTEEITIGFLVPFVFITFVFLRICYKKGEKPKWQWGPQTGDSE